MIFLIKVLGPLAASVQEENIPCGNAMHLHDVILVSMSKRGHPVYVHRQEKKSSWMWIPFLFEE